MNWRRRVKVKAAKIILKLFKIELVLKAFSGGKNTRNIEQESLHPNVLDTSILVPRTVCNAEFSVCSLLFTVHHPFQTLTKDYQISFFLKQL